MRRSHGIGRPQGAPCPWRRTAPPPTHLRPDRCRHPAHPTCTRPPASRSSRGTGGPPLSDPLVAPAIPGCQPPSARPAPRAAHRLAPGSHAPCQRMAMSLRPGENEVLGATHARRTLGAGGPIGNHPGEICGRPPSADRRGPPRPGRAISSEVSAVAGSDVAGASEVPRPTHPRHERADVAPMAVHDESGHPARRTRPRPIRARSRTTSARGRRAHHRPDAHPTRRRPGSRRRWPAPGSPTAARRPRIAPSDVATPLPPLPFSSGEVMWPSTAASPAISPHGSP